MSDPGGPTATADSLAALPRAWWFPALRGYRTGHCATYIRDEPRVPAEDDLSLEQILADLSELRRLGTETLLLDPYHGDAA